MSHIFTSSEAIEVELDRGVPVVYPGACCGQHGAAEDPAATVHELSEDLDGDEKKRLQARIDVLKAELGEKAVLGLTDAED